MEPLNVFEMIDIISYISLDTRLIISRINKRIRECVGRIKFKELTKFFKITDTYEIDFGKSHNINIRIDIGLNGSSRMYRYLNKMMRPLNECKLPKGIRFDFSERKSEIYALACAYNHYDFIDEYIDWVDNFDEDEIYIICSKVLRTRNYSIIEHIEKKKLKFNPFKIWSYNGKPITDTPIYANRYFRASCIYNDIEMVKKIIRIFPNFVPTLDHVLSACTHGCEDVVLFLVNTYIPMNEGIFLHACQGGLTHIVDDVLASHNYNQSYINNGFTMACNFGRLDIAKKLKDIGIDNNFIDIAFEYACCAIENMTTIEYLLSLGVSNVNVGLGRACGFDDKRMVDYLIAHEANDWNLGLKNAYECCGLHMIDYMLEKGATNLQELIEVTEGKTLEQLENEKRSLMSYAYIKTKNKV